MHFLENIFSKHLFTPKKMKIEAFGLNIVEDPILQKVRNSNI